MIKSQAIFFPFLQILIILLPLTTFTTVVLIQNCLGAHISKGFAARGKVQRLRAVIDDNISHNFFTVKSDLTLFRLPSS